MLGTRGLDWPEELKSGGGKEWPTTQHELTRQSGQLQRFQSYCIQKAMPWWLFPQEEATLQDSGKGAETLEPLWTDCRSFLLKR